MVCGKKLLNGNKKTKYCSDHAYAMRDHKIIVRKICGSWSYLPWEFKREILFLIHHQNIAIHYDEWKKKKAFKE